MTPTEIDRALKTLGWSGRPADRTRAVTDFQRGWNLGADLAIDGKPGRKTQAALQVSLTRRKQRKGTASAHFSFSEFRCECGGRQPGCAYVRVHRSLLDGLEVLRAKSGRAISIRSGYRCPRHNQAVGGAASSQHVYGAAADLAMGWKVTTMAKLRRFAGIGYSQSSKEVKHVDVRHVSGNNTTGGTPDRPTTWRYAS